MNINLVTTRFRRAGFRKWSTPCVVFISVLILAILVKVVVFTQGTTAVRTVDSNDETIFDFGERPSGSTVEHSFVFKNNAGTSLRIRKVTSSCSCTVVDSLPKLVRPGESLKVPVRATLGNTNGEFQTKVLLLLEKGTPAEFIIKGRIIGGSPPEVHFGRVTRISRPQQRLEIASASGRSLRIHSIAYDERYFDITSGKAAHDSRLTELTLRVKADAPYGWFNNKLRLMTDDIPQSLKVINVRGYILQPLEPKEARVPFGVVKRDDERTGQIEFYAPYGDEIQW